MYLANIFSYFTILKAIHILPTTIQYGVIHIPQNYLLQKRAVRKILAADYGAPGKPLFKNLVFLTVTVCILFRFEPSCTCITMKCCLALLLNLFQTGSQIHNYSIRYAELYCPQVCRTNIKQFTILYQGPNLWNSLPLTTNGTLTFNSH